MDNILLKAKLREVTGRKVNQLRNSDLIPAVVYGHGFANKNIAIHYNEFIKAFEQAGESTLVDLQIDETDPFKVLIQDVQKDSVSDRIIHTDLRQIKMDEKIEAEIPLRFIGTPPAVKELAGIFVTPLTVLHIKALPVDLVHEIDVNVAGLAQFHDKIYVKDLQISDKLEVLNKADTLVATVEPPRVEEKVEAKPEEEEAEAIKAQEGDVEEGDETEKKVETEAKDDREVIESSDEKKKN